MASFTERISVIIDVTTNKATQGLKDFRSAVGEAQGFTGKLKAGVSSLGQTFSSAISSPVAMTAAIGTAAKVAGDAVMDYVNLGEQVGNFSVATGLATEDASRWLEVAGDLGVEAGTLQASIGKLNKTIDPKLFQQLGVEIARTSTGAVDVNGTFLNVIDRLREIRDPAEQARVGAQLLGKGWQSVAPIIARSAKDIKEQLAGVADVKVFSAEDVKRSQEFKASLNDLKDVGEEVKLTLGKELAKTGADLGTTLARATQGFVDLKENMGLAGMSGLEMFNELTDTVSGWFSDSTPKIEYTGKAITNLGDSAGASQRYLGLLAQQLHDASGAADDFGGKAEYAKQSLKLLQNQISGRASFIDLAQQLKDNAEKIADLDKKYDKHLITAEDLYLGVAKAALDSKSAVAEYVAQVDAIPETQKFELTAQLDPKNPNAVRDQIQGLLDAAPFNVQVETNRETLRLLTGGMSGRSGSMNVTVNVAPGGDPHETARVVNDHVKSWVKSGGVWLG